MDRQDLVLCQIEGAERILFFKDVLELLAYQRPLAVFLNMFLVTASLASRLAANPINIGLDCNHNQKISVMAMPKVVLACTSLTDLVSSKQQECRCQFSSSVLWAHSSDTGYQLKRLGHQAASWLHTAQCQLKSRG